MHEMSLAEGIRQIVEDAARAQGFRRVRSVILEIGQLASVEVESLRFCFDVVMKDSIADGATLRIDTLPGQGWCMQCACQVDIAALYDPCPRCGSYQVQAVGGTEMRVKELEID
ncbi:hydrogenase maturation nickel metallochaperone HypA [Zoogloea sp.]|uniref:hydrogenase maturation nickel metallochaperone HypA n=1 Tax=Zoogloea sp. TaxID=49181 RepID=UPI0035AE2DEE|nr:hydrogenase maturation nickel metallochaperone HypA [Rhodocyclales bacterium]